MGLADHSTDPRRSLSLVVLVVTAGAAKKLRRWITLSSQDAGIFLSRGRRIHSHHGLLHATAPTDAALQVYQMRGTQRAGPCGREGARALLPPRLSLGSNRPFRRRRLRARCRGGLRLPPFPASSIHNDVQRMARRLTSKTQRGEAYETICNCQALIRRRLRTCFTNRQNQHQPLRC